MKGSKLDFTKFSVGKTATSFNLKTGYKTTYVDVGALVFEDFEDVRLLHLVDCQVNAYKEILDILFSK